MNFHNAIANNEQIYSIIHNTRQNSIQFIINFIILSISLLYMQTSSSLYNYLAQNLRIIQQKSSYQVFQLLFSYFSQRNLHNFQYVNTYTNALQQCVSSWHYVKTTKYIFLCLIFGNLILATISVGYYHHQKQIFEKEYVLEMIMLGGLGFVIVGLMDMGLKYIITQEQKQLKKKSNQKMNNFIFIRRKIFHVAPIIILPILAQLNINLLKIMLCGSFYLIFNLQLLRYSQQYQIGHKDNNDKQQKQQTAHSNYKSHNSFRLMHQQFVKIFSPLFCWMSSLNKSRQPNFWFTQIYLYLTIILSYEYYSNDHSKRHIGLLIILADGMAAYVGAKYGKFKLYKKKTLQGLAAFVLTMLVGQLILLNCEIEAINRLNSLFLMQTFIIGIITALTQLITGDLDNIACIWIYIITNQIFIHFQS